MAIKNLEQELEQVFSEIFKPGQLNPKAKKKGDKGIIQQSLEVALHILPSTSDRVFLTP